MRLLASVFGPPDINKLLNKEDVVGLAKALRRPEIAIRREAAQALGQLGARFHERAMSAQQADINSARRSGRLLPESGHCEMLLQKAASAAEALRASMSDDDASVRSRVVQALGELRLLPAFKALISALEDKDADVRRVAARGLHGWAGGGFLWEFAPAVPSLIATLGDSDPGVREVSRRALERCRDYFAEHRELEVWQKVNTALERVGSLSTEPFTRDALALALSKGRVNMEGIVGRLAAIYNVWPQGFIRGQGGPEQEIRRIGEALYSTGGIERMRLAHAEFQSRSSVSGAARNLEFLWEGIGTWRA